MKSKFARRTLLACAALLLPVAALAQSYPAKPVRVISPFAAGGGLDVVLRPLLAKMGENMGQSFYIDNRSGANGMVGIEQGVRSTPDGYTLIGVTSGAVTINPSVYAKMPYDTARDLVPVVNVAKAPFLMVVHPSVPARNVKEFVALMKSQTPASKAISYGSPGVGGTNHLGAEYFLQSTGLQMVHVPYRGSQPLMTDLMGGQVQVAFDSVMATLPLIRAGKLRTFGVMSAQRAAIAPEVPTLAEEGGPNLELNSWYGLMAPAGTPPQVIAKLNAEALKALADPQLKATYATMGVEIIGNSPAQFAAQIKEDTARWAGVAKTANVHAEQ